MKLLGLLIMVSMNDVSFDYTCIPKLQFVCDILILFFKSFIHTG